MRKRLKETAALFAAVTVAAGIAMTLPGYAADDQGGQSADKAAGQGAASGDDTSADKMKSDDQSADKGSGGKSAALDGSAPGGAVEQDENGEYFDKDGTPTFHVKEDGTVGWYTYDGYRRYSSECHVCHGPDGLGSTYAPALIDSIKGGLTYDQFFATVVNGKKDLSGGQEKVMPSFGTNQNVMCYLDDIWVYLRGRANGTIGRGRPGAARDPGDGHIIYKREDKTDAYAQRADDCFGS